MGPVKKASKDEDQGSWGWGCGWGWQKRRRRSCACVVVVCSLYRNKNDLLWQKKKAVVCYY